MSIQLNTAVVVIFSLEAPYLECFSPWVGRTLHIVQPLLRICGRSIQPKQHRLMQPG
ncbi:hypothetical protein OIU74_026378 [Salix koriyanagi]|uniref:Uncharacterized protein n=1 Tax=Salix koriyanagi TaxID=2511006 RepID=A0A9Q0VYU8_9ROSI|nr:hypothetical protein OIU74_026378 [Salix koriyanagi]